jgi:hypothetical protein
MNEGLTAVPASDAVPVSAAASRPASPPELELDELEELELELDPELDPELELDELDPELDPDPDPELDPDPEPELDPVPPSSLSFVLAVEPQRQQRAAEVIKHIFVHVRKLSMVIPPNRTCGVARATQSP